MTDPQQTPEPQPAAPASRITIDFPAAGAADPTIRLENVTPGQTMVAAWFLDAYAHELRAQAADSSAGQRIAVPRVGGGPFGPWASSAKVPYRSLAL